MKLSPITLVTSATEGSSARTFSACAITTSVRDTEAPSGSLATTKEAPWSSSGKKPVGVTSIPQIAPPATATMTRPITAMRSSRASAAP